MHMQVSSDYKKFFAYIFFLPFLAYANDKGMNLFIHPFGTLHNVWVIYCDSH